MTITNLVYFAQLTVLVCSALTYFWLVKTKLEFKLVRGIILTMGSFLLFLNLGQITLFTGILCFTPLLTFINITDADINHYSTSIRGYFSKLQNLQRSNHTVSQKKKG